MVFQLSKTLFLFLSPITCFHNEGAPIFSQRNSTFSEATSWTRRAPESAIFELLQPEALPRILQLETLPRMLQPGTMSRALAGILEPDVIVVHVAQNAVGFFTSCLAWWLIWWLTAPAQTSRVRRNAFECNSEDNDQEEECTDVDTISSLNLPSGPKLAWLLRRLAETAEDFANFAETYESHEIGFEGSLLSSRQQEKRRTFHDF